MGNNMSGKNEQVYKGFENIPVRTGETDISPAEAEFNPDKIECLDIHFLDLVSKSALQGASYRLARKGKIFAWKAMGTLHYKNGGLLQIDSLRNTASMTKIFTAISIFQLFEKGLLNINAPVAEVIDEFNTDMHKKISAHHLLTHTSGLRADGGYFNEPYHVQWDRESETWIKDFLAGPLQSEPGKVWAYNSHGFCILAELVSRITGIGYMDYVTKNIIEPLGLKDTFYNVPEEKLDRVCITDDWGRDYLNFRLEYKPGMIQPGGGGAYSTLYDMYRLGQCLLDNGTLNGVKIISRKSVELMTRNQLKNVPAYHWGANYSDYKYGTGLIVNKDDFSSLDTFGHEGAGFAMLYADREYDLVSMTFVPSDKGWTAESIDNPRAIIWSGIL